MGFWKRLFGMEEQEARYGPYIRKRLVAKQKGEKGSGVLYLEVNKYTYFRLPERSELNQDLKLKGGDEVVLTIEKICD